MKANRYLSPRSSFSPTMEIYKKVNNNPKLFKLAKIFSKNLSKYAEVNQARWSSLDSSSSLPKPIQSPAKRHISVSELTKIPHLPKLSSLEDSRTDPSYLFHNFHLSPSPEKSCEKRLPHKKDVASNLLIFDFNGLHDVRRSSVKPRAKQLSMVPERRQKLLINLRNPSISPMDSSLASDYQETFNPIHSSFSYM